MTIQLSGGVVSIEDGTKKAEEYTPPRKVRVELRFDVAEGQDGSALLDGVATLAQAKVSELLGTTAPAAITAPAAAKATRTTKKGGAADMIVDPPASSGSTTAASTTSSTPSVEEIPGLGGAEPETVRPTEAPSGGDSLDDIMGLAPEPAKEITDADLNAAVQKKNGELQAPPLIRDLIIKFQPDASKPPLLANIAQAQRAQFLAELTTLAKAS